MFKKIKPLSKSKKAKTQPKTHEDISWLYTKLVNNDRYYRIENQVAFLNALF